VLRQYYVLTKPRVNLLILFCAVIGMLLAQPSLAPIDTLVYATLGIGFVAGAAAAVNCLVESHIDAKMARTAWRPLPSGTLTVPQTLVFSGVLGGLGMWILFDFVNPLTAWLTLATFVGYAIVYTLILKPLTPQNIVIGGASGAMPPVLGAEDFAALAVPTLVTVGTEDLKQAPNLSGYEWRRQPYDLIPPGQKYLLTLEGADHYLGGSVGRDDLARSAQADDFVAAFQAASTLFLDAWLKDDKAAKRRLSGLPSTAAPFAAHATLQQR